MEYDWTFIDEWEFIGSRWYCLVSVKTYKADEEGDMECVDEHAYALDAEGERPRNQDTAQMLHEIGAFA